ncbi:MAG: protein of unknown function [Nitrospira sp.]
MSLGSISISQGSVLDVSGNAGGTVRIRGGTFVMDQAAISANSVDADGAPVAIDIHTTGNVSISTTDVPALTAMTTGTGNAGEVKITSGSTDITGTAINSFLFSVIDTHTSGSGRAGNVAIDTGDLNFTAIQFAGVPIFVDSGTIGPNGGHGGDISIRAHNFTANDTVINSGNSLALQLGEESTGSAGNISISADSLQFSNVIVVADAFSLFSDNIGQSGNILLNVPNIALDQSVVTTVGGERGGSLVINTDHLTANNTQLTAQTFQSPGGGITVNGSTIELTGGSSFVSSTGGDGSAGPINITATDHLLLSRVNPTDQVSGIFSNSFGSVSGLGNAGDITITTPILTMTGGSRINTSTATNGHGGNVIIHADTISMSGEAGEVPPPPLFALGVTQQSGIFTLSTGGNCAGACGDAGNISITTHSLSMGAGSQINSGTSGSGRGGNITIDAADSIAMAGTISTGEPGGIFSRAIGTDPGSGSGGNITLLAGNSVTISDGAQVSASTLGPGNAGNITIQGLASPAQSVLITGAGSGIFTDTQGSGAGGNIVVNANSVTLSDGGALSATTSGPNHGGDIQISATTIDLSGLSTISALSSAGDNTAGNAGNIALRATQQITAVNSFLNTDTVGGSGLGGNILLRAPTITVDGAVLSTSTSGAGNAGNILLEGQRINSQGAGADLFAVTSGSGHGGTVTLRGLDGPGSSAESVTISGASRVHSLTAADGTAGDISIHAGQFTLTDHATINADTFGAGAAGAITIAATQQALISGSSTAISSSSDSGATGHAGQITLSAPTVMIENGGRILTSTTGGAAGGDIGITAGQSFIMTNGASISANSTGTGNAGSVQITAGNQFAMTNSTITTEANQSSGGIIKITTNPSGTVDLSNSTISASVLDGSGGGGSVSLDPQFVILQNSQILAQAQQGPGGNINITITNGGTFLPDATSVVSASSQFGQQGTVTIQAPIAPAGGKIQPLGKAPLQVTALLSQRCAAIARGEISSFVVAGRDTLPTEPGGWLPSPLALGPPEAGAAVHAGDRTSSSESSEPTILSLRRLPSPSKVAQLLTDDWVTDCGS